ncbi:polyphosphate kinase 1 [soil metagenome]
MTRTPTDVGGRAATPQPGADVDLDDPDLYLNRELSWLEFNRRVLAQATDSDVPPLERVRFVAIFHANLDEFFQIRVSGLKRQVAAGVTRRTADGRTPAEQLDAIAKRLGPMVAAAQDCVHDQLLPLLARNGVALHSVRDLEGADREHVDRYFDDEVFPVLTPLAVDPGHPFPYISNLSLSLAVTVEDRKTGEEHFARLKVPGVLPRFVPLPDGHRFVTLEELINSHLEQLFPGMTVREAFAFRVTRNTDLDLEEEEAEDLLMAIEQELRRRRFGAVVRLEASVNMSERMLRLLQEELDVGDSDTYRVQGMLGAGDLAQLVHLDLPGLRYEPWHPIPHPRMAPGGDVFAEIRRGDILVHHPYDSFQHTVERFITAAADDSQVLAIKQTLYRTSGDSPIVQSLIRAAERGKQVVALVELKARFDEEANIVWARALEKVGVHVVYGLVGLKTHSKTSLVVRREPDGLRRYAHIGTGNYNPRTARMYTDLGLFTCDEAIGADLTDLFNYLTGYARQDTYRSLLVAPVSLRERIRELIQREIELHSQDRRGVIRLKLNALVDSELIADLYRASRAGVQVDLIVRGICGLRPGIPGISDRIRAVSVVGRFLEHSRVMQFGPDELWIGSADWMPRNIERRVEAMAPVRDPALREELRAVLDLMMADNVQGWSLTADGSWTRRFPGDGEQPISSQEWLMEHSRSRAAEASALAEPTEQPTTPGLLGRLPWSRRAD